MHLLEDKQAINSTHRYLQSTEDENSKLCSSHLLCCRPISVEQFATGDEECILVSSLTTGQLTSSQQKTELLLRSYYASTQPS